MQFLVIKKSYVLNYYCSLITVFKHGTWIVLLRKINTNSIRVKGPGFCQKIIMETCSITHFLLFLPSSPLLFIYCTKQQKIDIAIYIPKEKLFGFPLFCKETICYVVIRFSYMVKSFR